MRPAPPPEPTEVITSADGTGIAVFTSGDGSPLVLVHGTSADHTTFRVIGPLLATSFAVHAIDRRGRGASSDRAPHSIVREFEDVAAVADRIADRIGRPVDVFGHSYGGRCVLGAARHTDAIRRVISYEGAPTPAGWRYHSTSLQRELAGHLAEGDGAAVLASFLREVVGMSDADLAAYRANPVWPARVAAAPTIIRELVAEQAPDASLRAMGRIHQPVLQILGTASLPVFPAATEALDARLTDGRIVRIDGARHAAHHTHPGQVVDAVRAFLRD
jgi:pimeloyl-ACP methyl ester carboxylesterase